MRKKLQQDTLKGKTQKPLFIISAGVSVTCIAILLFSQQPHSMQEYAQTTALSPSPIPSISLPPFGCVAIGNCGVPATSSGTAAFPSGVPANIPAGVGGLTGGTGTTAGGGFLAMISNLLQGFGSLMGFGGGTAGIGGVPSSGTVQTNVVNNDTNSNTGTATGATTNTNNFQTTLNGTGVPAGTANTAIPAVGTGTTGTGTTGLGGFFAPMMNFFQSL